MAIIEIKTSIEIIEKQWLHVPNVGNIHLYILQLYKIRNVNTRSCMRFKGRYWFLLRVDSNIVVVLRCNTCNLKFKKNEQSNINIKKSIKIIINRVCDLIEGSVELYTFPNPNSNQTPCIFPKLIKMHC